MIDSRLKDAVVVASVSGGKDSTAMSLWLTEQGIEHRRVFMDTGWEHEFTYEYLRGPLQQKLGAIEEVRAELLFEDLVKKKGMFPGRFHRYCSEQLKLVPIRKFIEAVRDEGTEVVNPVGIRAAESKNRSEMAEWEWSEHFDCWTWRPLIRWTETEVIAIHTRHGLAPNPLYLQGSERVGCWPCLFARKKEIRRLAEVDPARIDRIRKLEAAVQDAARIRYEAKGETFESLGYSPPTMLLVPISGTHRRRMASIDEVVAWANTPDPPRWKEPEGYRPCAKWGLCDVEPDEPEVDQNGEVTS